MMLKKKSNPWKLSKYLIVFPLAAIAAILFARPNLLNMNNQEGNAFIQDTLDVRHFEEILVSKSYAESDTVQIIEIDTLKMHIPVGYARIGQFRNQVLMIMSSVIGKVFTKRKMEYCVYLRLLRGQKMTWRILFIG